MFKLITAAKKTGHRLQFAASLLLDVEGPRHVGVPQTVERGEGR